MLEKLKNIGPGILVTAAFIGPGSVTLCTKAGAQFGYALLWALLFSVFATIILQEMTARLGATAKLGLGESLHTTISQQWLKQLLMLLVFSAIIIGNGAYQAGNIAGAAAGLQAFHTTSFWPLIIGGCAFFFLWKGSQRLLTRFLIVLILLMSVVFVATAFLSSPDWAMLFNGFKPVFIEDAWITIVALIGTTIVPYNLFLHASKVKETKEYSLETAKLDLYLSVPLGGLISAAILVSAASFYFQAQQTPNSVLDIAKQLEPLLGSFATPFLGLGFFAAGLSSAITAPLAAAYVAKEIFQKEVDSWWFKGTWMLVLCIGVLFASFGIKPIQVIVFAQLANGILLPIIVAYLIWVMNQNIPSLKRNTNIQNLLSIFVFLVAVVLSYKSLWSVFNG